MLTDFQTFLTIRLVNKSSLNIPPHSKRVATRLCHYYCPIATIRNSYCDLWKTKVV